MLAPGALRACWCRAIAGLRWTPKEFEWFLEWAGSLKKIYLYLKEFKF